jgi:hypothetical protein
MASIQAKRLFTVLVRVFLKLSSAYPEGGKAYRGEEQAGEDGIRGRRRGGPSIGQCSPAVGIGRSNTHVQALEIQQTRRRTNRP